MTDSTLNTQLVPVRKDAETIRREVLTNTLKMFVERGYITTSYENNLKVIEKISDNDIYEFTLDNPMQPDTSKTTDPNYPDNFVGNKLGVKIIHQEIKGISKTPIIKEFIDKRIKDGNKNKFFHKLFIVDKIADKAKATLTNIPNLEVFEEKFLMINLVDHIDSPKYQILTDEECKEVLNDYIVARKELPKTLTSDPVVAYFNLKRGQIMRVIRCSEQSGKSIVYRIVANGSQ